MKITVATVCFNARETISRTIESVAAQTHKNVEHLIYDGGSTDGTLDILKAAAERHRLRIVSEPDRGMYDALNKALANFSGDAFGVLNADDRYADENALARIAAGLAKADIVYGHLDFVDREGRITRRWRGRPRPASGFRAGWMPAHPTFYVRREVAKRVGPFELGYPTAADYHWMMRAMEDAGTTSRHLPHVLIAMQQGGRSTASLAAHVRHNIEAARARRDVLSSRLVDRALVLKPARKVGQFIVRHR